MLFCTIREQEKFYFSCVSFVVFVYVLFVVQHYQLRNVEFRAVSFFPYARPDEHTLLAWRVADSVNGIPVSTTFVTVYMLHLFTRIT